MTTTEPALTLDTVPYTHPEAQRLIAATMADLAERYGGDGDSTPVSPAEFDPPGGAFLVAWLGDEPVGCGGWRSNGPDAEIKRMYTVPAVRGRGVARAVLAALEDSARAAGMRRAILVTGHKQPEAIRLYESRGYQRIANFGFYKDEPEAVCFGRDLR